MIKSISLAAMAGALSLTMGVAAMAQSAAPTNTRPNDNTTDAGVRGGARAPAGLPGVGIDRQDRREQRVNDIKQQTTDQGAATAASKRAPPGMPGATTRKDVQQQRTNDIKQQTSDEGTTSGKPSR